MKKFILIAFILFTTSPVLAGNKVFTDEDLEKYSSKPDAVREETPKEQPEEKKEKIEPVIKKVEDTQNVECEVINFNTYEKSYADVPFWGGRAPITRKQYANVHIRSHYGLQRWVRDFFIIAIFENGTHEISQMLPKEGDSPTTWIAPGDDYYGVVRFDGNALIVKMECSVNPGL